MTAGRLPVPAAVRCRLGTVSHRAVPVVIARGAGSGDQPADSEPAQDLPERRLPGGFQGEILHGDACGEPPRSDQYLSRGQDAHYDSTEPCGAR
jgi:hypothetical protein